MNEMTKPDPDNSGIQIVPTRGVDHLALVTDDMATTMDFYTRVLKMQLVHVRRVPYAAERGQPPYDDLRHYFFDMGGEQLLAFFEYPKDVAWGDRDHLGMMQHVAFHVPREEMDPLVAHVRSCGVEVAGPMSLGGRFWSAYLFDPNGIRLEFATSLASEGVGIVGSVYQTAEEARAELETLFDDPAEIERWLAVMPLLSEDVPCDPPPR
jgi:catechol 2,3-dioxygenase-like lactoylglutathione lyase family enzyme